MKREMFKRPTRMVHRFGSEEASTPLSGSTFDPGFPKFPEQQSKQLTIRRHGEHCNYGQYSAIVKPNGVRAALSGPAPDLAGDIAATIPASTKKRTPFKPT